jgi:4-hydroxybenzoate polyprenyltransferase
MLSAQTIDSSLNDEGLDRNRPLCVDLDGTLIHGDLFWESLTILLGRNPLYAVLALVWSLKGRAYLKTQIASRVSIDPRSLPYNDRFVSYLQEQNRARRPLIMVTAASRITAEPIARQLDLFSEVIASSDRSNIKGDRKRTVLEGRFGRHGYDYAGNSSADLVVWKGCRRAIVVNGSSRLEKRAAAVSTVERSFPKPRTAWKIFARAARIHQWVKNVLVFLPVIAAHQVLDLEVWAVSAVAFAAFCLCASSVYVLNDLLDLTSDRLHATKRERPFASGALSIPFGFGLTAFLLGASIIVSSFLPGQFRLTLAGYYALTLTYSLFLKRKLMIDIVALSGLYTIRVLAGGSATGIALSPWFLAFFVFLFFSLALIKRFVELRSLKETGSAATVAGRRYTGEDLQVIGSLGTSSGFMCVLVLALYINSPQVLALYRSPAVLWFLCPLILYWISRVWVMANRGYVNGDPILFAMRDKATYATAGCGAIILALAAHGL